MPAMMFYAISIGLDDEGAILQLLASLYFARVTWSMGNTVDRESCRKILALSLTMLLVAFFAYHFSMPGALVVISLCLVTLVVTLRVSPAGTLSGQFRLHRSPEEEAILRDPWVVISSLAVLLPCVAMLLVCFYLAWKG